MKTVKIENYAWLSQTTTKEEIEASRIDAERVESFRKLTPEEKKAFYENQWK